LLEIKIYSVFSCIIFCSRLQLLEATVFILLSWQEGLEF